VESAPARFLRELKVPAVITVIVFTVWTVAYCAQMEQRAQIYQPAPAHAFSQDPTEPDVDLAVSAPVEPLERD
jgi:hypothetical protein